jgi:putative component of toxin-antitoxin plasmid stabilization module
MDGTCPSEVFLTKLGAPEQTAFRARLERLTTVGYLRSPEQFRRLNVPGEPSVSEIKVDKGPGWRLYVVTITGEWVATHGGKKPKDKRVPAEADKARQIFREWTNVR